MTTTQDRLDHLVALLRSKGHRMSPQRVAILSVLVRSPDHPDAEEVHRRILPEFPTASLATVYKTITLLKKEGEILELGFSDLGSRYDANKPHPHPHLICIRCGEILDSDSEDVDELVRRLADAAGYAVTTHRFDLFGLCPKCQSR